MLKKDKMKLPDKLEILIITLSDRASKGEYKDLSGPQIKSFLQKKAEISNWNYEIKSIVIEDSKEKLKDILIKNKEKYNVIFTTGGTGIGPRDITVDVVEELLDKKIPGIMELIRVKYGMIKPNAALSRGVSGVMGKSLIYTLPGSVKAVNEYMTEILKTMEHLVYMQYGVDIH